MGPSQSGVLYSKEVEPSGIPCSSTEESDCCGVERRSKRVQVQNSSKEGSQASDSLSLEIRSKIVVHCGENAGKRSLVLGPVLACRGAGVYLLWGNTPNSTFRLEAVPQFKTIPEPGLTTLRMETQASLQVSFWDRVRPGQALPHRGPASTNAIKVPPRGGQEIQGKGTRRHADAAAAVLLLGSPTGETLALRERWGRLGSRRCTGVRLASVTSVPQEHTSS